MTGLAAPVPTTGVAVGAGVGEGVAVATIDAVGLAAAVPGAADGVMVDAQQAATAPQMQTLASTTADLRITRFPRGLCRLQATTLCVGRSPHSPDTVIRIATTRGRALECAGWGTARLTNVRI
jgi:hypothetical protein